MTDFASTLLQEIDSRASRGPVPGLRYAEIVRKEDDGTYVLTWLSGAVRSESAPARAAAFMAGGERGGYFPFEVGDEVVVGFIEGHLDQPVILGALWSDQDKPPADADTSADNNIRIIQSREGSSLTFDDTQGATALKLKSAGGMEVVLDDKAKTLTIKFDASTSIEMSTAGITVKGAAINLN
ncbi:phage baseplate assembly protein V [Sphingomonas psychrotolerans]|uniref:Gp5/Type VI secretion system Vgr protein OB-fold domain-containing protein n=1 Tax=Sphingomonas psychrotolerans TaxID=1327635 RepID=A0A2K8MD95_9SPHN|nr:phage baseplate assembly protein V [Sphingomonas psychrotolerans]ATY30914.1 hypothetical protein CVN68_02035 [Sphingomonas psychrotolerans]